MSCVCGGGKKFIPKPKVKMNPRVRGRLCIRLVRLCTIRGYSRGMRASPTFSEMILGLGSGRGRSIGLSTLRLST